MNLPRRLVRFLFACGMSLASMIVGSTSLGIGSVQAATAQGENWPQWRGPRLDGVSHDTGLPSEWADKGSKDADKKSTEKNAVAKLNPGKNIAWRLPLPGPAGATPVVWDDHIFLTSADGEDLVFLAVNTSGKILWRKVLGSGNKNVRGDEGNSASPSPATDGQHVWVMTGAGILACFDFDGKEIWRTDLQKRYGHFEIQFGMTSTPVLDGDRLYLQLIHSGGATILSLDKATGEEQWRVGRKSDARDECEQSYASPTIYRDDHLALLLTHGADYIVAHQLTDGKEVWRCGGLNPKAKYNNTLRFVSSPVAVPGMIIVPSAKNGPVLALKPEGHGDITNNTSLHYWTRPQNTPDVSSPLVNDGLVYLCRENGNLICMDAETGKQLYDHRTHPDRHRASPVYADGKLYIAARDGTVTVVKAGKTYEELASNAMGEDISASPVVANRTLYLRTFEALYAIRAAN